MRCNGAALLATTATLERAEFAVIPTQISAPTVSTPYVERNDHSLIQSAATRSRNRTRVWVAVIVVATVS
ncbi:hypothetical protein C1I99_05535 [Micromonospora deserti]|uniref:Uncharacterized protein n=1 Tax=Micromonospora deserti TaxID=2070366 RepID=A0A2W2CQQ1_9ACTN|nr:hypothetical protein C1I99_05535 [Micromonospora deserti]